MKKNLSASVQAKNAGLPNLNYVMDKTDVGRSTLELWAKRKPRLIFIVIYGCVFIRTLEKLGLWHGENDD